MLARLSGLCCLLLGLAAFFLTPASASEPRVALVIGNSSYGPAIGRLQNPTNDAKLMAETLKGLGFSVDLVLDADQKTMKRAVKGFGTKLQDAGKEATGLFYYAGHGVQVDGTNFLLPIGAEIEKESDVEIESISADDVMTQMQFAGNAVNLVFLDACRNNPLASSTRSATRGLARLDAPRGSFVGYSTAPGDVAADGDGANSPYALALVAELKKPGISVEEAHRNVRARVLAETGNKQTPWDSSSLTGAVVLAARAAEPAPQPAAKLAPQPQEQASVNMEVVFWESIKDSNDPDEFEAYLQQYPQGSFAPLARTKVSKLNAAPTAMQLPSAPASDPVPTPAPAPAPAPTSASASTQVALGISVSAEIKEEIEKYLRNAGGSGRYFALAITKDGSQVASLTCDKTAYDSKQGCGGWAPNQQHVNDGAVRKCGGFNTCILLYEGTVQRPSLQIVPQTAAASATEAVVQAQAAPTQKSVSALEITRIVVKPEVMAEYERYVANCAVQTDRPCYIAVNRAGDKIAYQKAPVIGGTQWQELLPRNVLSTCGGADECVLIYDRGRKNPNIDLVIQ